MSPARVIVAGCGGAMGRAILKSATDKGVALGGGFEHPESPLIGRDLATLIDADTMGSPITDKVEEVVTVGDVVIDFTVPAATIATATSVAAQKGAMVIGTTGFSDKDEEKIRSLSKEIPIVKSGNMSLGVNLLCALVNRAAASLPDNYDIEIVEAHHRRKVDAPSGTALMLGVAAAEGRQISLTENSVRTRDGISEPRKTGEIGFAVIRGGGIIGDHEVQFAGDKELLTLSHHAIDRSLFADGAIAAAQWVAGKPPGLYSMRNVLGLE